MLARSPADPPQEAAFSVRSWLDRDQGSSRPLNILRPQQVGCWTKESAKSASQAGLYLYGSKNGLMHYALPELPQDLNQGYPEAFERKPEDEGTPVETIIRGAMHSSTLANLRFPTPQQQQQQQQQHARSLIHGADVVTFRNNLNKICGTPLSPRDGWVVDACMHNGTLFLDMSKSGAENMSKNLDISRAAKDVAVGWAEACMRNRALFQPSENQVFRELKRV